MRHCLRLVLYYAHETKKYACFGWGSAVQMQTLHLFLYQCTPLYQCTSRLKRPGPVCVEHAMLYHVFSFWYVPEHYCLAEVISSPQYARSRFAARKWGDGACK